MQNRWLVVVVLFLLYIVSHLVVVDRRKNKKSLHSDKDKEIEYTYIFHSVDSSAFLSSLNFPMCIDLEMIYKA